MLMSRRENSVRTFSRCDGPHMSLGRVVLSRLGPRLIQHREVDHLEFAVPELAAALLDLLDRSFCHLGMCVVARIVQTLLLQKGYCDAIRGWVLEFPLASLWHHTTLAHPSQLSPAHTL